MLTKNLKHITSTEEWRGTESIPAIMGFLSLGVPITVIAKRFGVTRHTIRRTLDKEKATCSQQQCGHDPNQKETGVVGPSSIIQPPTDHKGDVNETHSVSPR